MMTIKAIRRASLGAALAAALATTAAMPSPALGQRANVVAPSNDVTLSVGAGQMVRLGGTMSDLFVANDTVADVQVRSPTQIYIFGKAAGNTTVYATDRAGRVIYSANVRVGQNLASVDQMLAMAMPEAEIQATPMNGVVLLTGTVAQPDDAAEAERLAQAFVGEGTQIVSRLRTATPQQVMLKVTIAEVNRTLLRNVGVNIQALNPGANGFFFGQGRDFINNTGQILFGEAGATGGMRFSDLFGLSGAVSTDLEENNGLVTILAEPSLTALSGETASFLAGGEFPIPISQSLGNTTVEYRQYGVGLAFTPYVLQNGRISMRVRPEVSELSSAGAIEFNGFEVPSLTIRRTETTVELGSGQSLVIGGLMRNNANNSVTRTPFLGSLPIIGALFRSNNFRRDETELVVMVTPYLVQPVSASQIALPTDGYRTANDAQRLLGDQSHDGRSGERRPVPTTAQPQTVGPGIGTGAGTQPSAAAQPADRGQQLASAPAPAAQPGFDF
jgi:pilus assembly protein CpaC